MRWIGEAGWILIFVAITLGQGAIASQSDDVVTVELSNDRSSVTVQSSNGAGRRCRFTEKIEKAQLSHDGSAVILSDVAYIPVSQLTVCGDQPVVVKKISDKVGFLVDINLSAGIYMSLEVVGTSPLSFVAIVAKLGSTKNIVSLPGARTLRKNMNVLKEQAFPYDETKSGILAKDGRHASPAGVPDCSPNAYPGVWNLKMNKRVVLTGDDADRQCRELFL